MLVEGKLISSRYVGENKSAKPTSLKMGFALVPFGMGLIFRFVILGRSDR